VLEAGEEVAAGVASWGHVRLFSPWRFSVDPVAKRILEASGWTEPDGDEHATGAELRERYLPPLAELRELAARIRTGASVLAVTRHATDKMKDAGREQAPFELVVQTATARERILTQAVIDASGSLAEHNPLGSAGCPRSASGAGRAHLLRPCRRSGPCRPLRRPPRARRRRRALGDERAAGPGRAPPPGARHACLRPASASSPRARARLTAGRGTSPRSPLRRSPSPHLAMTVAAVILVLTLWPLVIRRVRTRNLDA
jgi:hypothetical protein